MPEATRHPLLRVPPEQYGPSYTDHLLEQYKLYVESAQAVSERRTSANNYLLTVNAFLVTLYGLASSITPSHAWRFAIPVAGLLVSSSWFVLVRSYRSLNTGKFTVIHELERHLPAALFDHEWLSSSMVAAALTNLSLTSSSGFPLFSPRSTSSF